MSSGTNAVPWLLLSLLSILTIIIGVMGSVGVFTIDYISDYLTKLLPDVQLYFSRLFLIQSITLFLAGVFLHWIAIMKLASRQSPVLLMLGFSLAVINLGLQLYMIALNGFNWIGREFFHGQPVAEHSLFSYSGISLLLLALILTGISGMILFEKRGS